MRFTQGLSDNLTFSYGRWDVDAFMASNDLETVGRAG
ncbi:hypothetical protein BH23VER1_BH23VER1_18460 [soil metagenome]